ncbi:MAG TPA: sigma 54-interacting transcriptional regulator, partial [Polyangia bacterium]
PDDPPDDQTTAVGADPPTDLPGERTARETRALRPPPRRLCLLVLGNGFFATHPLPDEGDYLIGRGTRAALRLDQDFVSRAHAVVHCDDPLTVEDLGSANGTRVNGRALRPGERAPLEPGGMLEIGATVLVLQYHSAATRPRRAAAHGDFEHILESACARAEHEAEAAALVMLHVDGAHDEAALQGLVLRAIRPGDHLGLYAPRLYEVLLPACTAEGAVAVIARVAAALAAAGARVARSGIACFGADGRSAEALLARARAQAAGTPGGPREPLLLAVDPVMRRLHELCAQVAAGTISVLLLGETGVGKEVIAERLHRLSPRADRPLLRLNCAALSESLLESELFGHERGAFTGATQTKPGLLETAQGGTVLLDEIGDLSAGLQAKLLRVLEERQVRRVGGLKPRPIDVRFIAATHHDLEAEAERGRFRRDLYFRLNGVTLAIPPLRERPAEVEPLARAFVSAACAQAERWPEPELAPDALRLLRGYPWPGNVRELRNVMERAVLLCRDAAITAAELPADKMRARVSPTAAHPVPVEAPTLGLRRDAYERQQIIDALERCHGNQSQAAQELGMPRRTLIRRIEAYGLTRPRKR